jgi:hypothetical protein
MNGLHHCTSAKKKTAERKNCANCHRVHSVIFVELPLATRRHPADAMLPGLYWLAGDKLRGRIEEGLNALRAVTEAASISFVDTAEVEQQGGHLARLQGEMATAMEEERYEDARRAQNEMHVMLLPSQQSQRRMERRQAQEAAEQVRLAVPCPEGVLQRLARQSWQRSVANCDSLQFVPTTPEKTRHAPRVQRLPSSEHRLEPAAAGSEETASRRIGALGSEVEGTMLDVTEELHMCLVQQPPAVARAGECALHMIALVGETEGGEAELEMVGACVDKVARKALNEIKALLAGDLYFPPDPRWRHQLASALSMCKVCQELGEEDDCWDLVSDLAQRFIQQMQDRGEVNGSWEATLTALTTVPEHVVDDDASSNDDDDLTLSDPLQRGREEERQRAKDSAVLERLMVMEELLSVTLEMLRMMVVDTCLEGHARVCITQRVTGAASTACQSVLARLVRGLDVLKHIAALRAGHRRVGQRHVAMRDAMASTLKLLEAYESKLTQLVPLPQDETYLSDQLAAEISTAVSIYDSLCEVMESSLTVQDSRMSDLRSRGDTGPPVT